MGIMKRIHVLGIPKPMLELEMTKVSIETTKNYQCSFQDVLESEDSINQEEVHTTLEEAEDERG